MCAVGTGESLSQSSGNSSNPLRRGILSAGRRSYPMNAWLFWLVSPRWETVTFPPGTPIFPVTAARIETARQAWMESWTLSRETQR